MKYCKECLQPDTRPNTIFNENGVCPACVYHKKMSQVDWNERSEIMQDIISKFVNKDKCGFNCIMGVSGGKDSIRQALWVRDKLKLKPLLVCLGHTPEMGSERGFNNLSHLIELGFDVVISHLAPETWRYLMKESFLRFTNHGKSPELALFSSVPQIAIRYGIKLILHGENPALQLGDLSTLGRNGYDGNNLRMMNTLSGGGLDWILDTDVKIENLIGYRYPSLKEFEDNDLQIVYLGWFWGDWSLVDNAMYACTNGIEIREDVVENTGDLYGVTSLDDEWVTLNQMIKYYKFGFGRVTDYANEGIRSGKMSRDYAINLVEKYDSACDESYIESFCSYIDISKDLFWDKVYSSLNKDLFDIKPDGSICKKFKVGKGL